MIRINSFLHRQRLVEITRRWFYNQMEPGDLPALKALVNFNSLWISRIGRDSLDWLLPAYFQQPIESRQAKTKGELKDLLVQFPVKNNERSKHLIRRYQEHPDRYFRETPFSGIIYFLQQNGHPKYIGSRRIKRIRRIAEKSARRVSDFIYEQIKAGADDLAQQRADLLGIPKQKLISSKEEMIDEFERAERRIGLEIKRGRLFREPLEFALEDILGAKVIVEEKEQPRLIKLLEDSPRCQILEIEHHRGHYNATNLVFRYFPDRDRLLSEPLSEKTLHSLRARGMNPSTVSDEFRTFVLTGEESIHMELILSTYDEMLESEIGRSMHEERIVRQRHQQTYRGHLARNVSYLMEFIFACGISPLTEIPEIPIKVWIEYMPDYFDEVIKALFQIPTFREIE